MIPRWKARSFLIWAAAFAAAFVPAFGQSPQTWVQVADDFSSGSGGWLAGFTDYSLEQGAMDRLAEVRDLPDEVQEADGKGYFLRSMNRSDDMFMYLKKALGPLDGVEGDTEYEVEVVVDVASNAQSGCVGAGGAPGESVHFKVGASPVEPVSVLTREGMRLNLDKGGQATGGEDAEVAGDIANGLPCDPADKPFVLLERRHRLGRTVRSTSSGQLWVFFGTDSGFEGLTELYYSRVVVLLTRVEGGSR